MALWLVRAGKFGEYEQKFLDDGRIYLTWWGFDRDLSKLGDKAKILDALREVYPNDAPNRLKQNSNQINAFAHRIAVGDWVALPSKRGPAIHIGKVTGTYEFQSKAENPYYHSRKIDWFAKETPKSLFDQDILYSLGAFSTICHIDRNNAEARVKAIVEGKKPPPLAVDDDEGEASDLAEASRNQIAHRIQARFAGHNLAVLVEELLRARGYTVYRSPKGADQGIDLLASSGPLGFAEPKIAVQVKSQQGPLESNVLNELKGAMESVSASHGLLVAWGGFKGSYEQLKRQNFFKIRLWSQDQLIDELLELYESLPESIRAELPLQRIWTLASDTEI